MNYEDDTLFKKKKKKDKYFKEKFKDKILKPFFTYSTLYFLIKFIYINV